MVSRHRASGVQDCHDAHVGAGGRNSADEPGEEMLIVALQHLPANELSEECRDEDRQALHPSTLVEEAESGTGHARGCRVGEGVVARMHLLDLLKLGLEVLDGFVGSQVVDDAAQRF